MAKTDQEIMDELKDATVRVDAPFYPALKNYHNVIIILDPASTTTLDEYLRIIKR